MKYIDYKTARDLAWRTLIENHVTSLPVRVSAIIKANGINLIPYSMSQIIISSCGLEAAAKNDGFALILGNRKIILFDEAKPIGRQRFTVAHELGHHLLGHTMRLNQMGISYTTYNREISDTDRPEEHEANVFASRLLAPVCVLHELGLHRPFDIAQTCNISIDAAKIRSERMAVLSNRNCFYLSPLERVVISQFSDYIKGFKDRDNPLPRDFPEE